MSYISNLDATVMHAPVAAPSRTTSVHSRPLRLNFALPVGQALEVVLMVATSAAVSLVICTAFAGALLK